MLLVSRKVFTASGIPPTTAYLRKRSFKGTCRPSGTGVSSLKCFLISSIMLSKIPFAHRNSSKVQKTKRVSQLFYKITREFLNNLTFSYKVKKSRTICSEIRNFSVQELPCPYLRHKHRHRVIALRIEPFGLLLDVFGIGFLKFGIDCVSRIPKSLEQGNSVGAVHIARMAIFFIIIT